MRSAVIFGTGSLARLAFIHLASEGQYDVVAFTVTHEYLLEQKVFDRDVVPYEEIVQTHPPDRHSMFVAVGYRGLNKARARICDDCRAKGYELLSCVSPPTNQTAHIQVGANCLIMPHAIVQPFAEIGNDVIVWGGSCIGYQSHIGDHCYIAPDAVIAGNVEVGEYCFIGANSTIRDGLTIAPECVIGAGAVVLKNTERGRVYRGQSAEMSPYLSTELKYFK